jgi:diacylglycerol kinase (ATP)
MSLLLYYEPFYNAFYFESYSFHALIVLFMFCAGPFTFFLKPLTAILSRKYEYQADRFAAVAVNSIKGLKSAFKHEAAFRQELLLAAILIPLACYLDVTQVERILLIAPLFLVVIIEIINSAIEAVVDRIGEERHKLAGRAKDMGSAAVLIALTLTAYIWIEILFL